MPAAYAAAFRPIACGNTASYARLYRDVRKGRLCIRRAFFLLEDPPCGRTDCRCSESYARALVNPRFAW